MVEKMASHFHAKMLFGTKDKVTSYSFSCTVK